MNLAFLPLDRLSVSTANMRHARKAPDVADILPTIRARGVLQPVIVRACAPRDTQDMTTPQDPCCRYEIVAGARRFHAARIVAEEQVAAGADPAPMPCAILDPGDDADAVEASLIENLARRDADEVTQWECFTRLIREGRSIDELSITFGMPALAIRRVLALGNLLPRIRRLYARGEIDRTTVRHLTLATTRQQRDWLALADDPHAQCPVGARLKAWLFGGASIEAANALFEIAASGLATVTDLFGEVAYFADGDGFWRAQHEAIDGLRARYLAKGWREVVIVPVAEQFAAWNHVRVAKREGGRVYLDVRPSGEVVVHEGYVTTAEARRAARGEPGEPAPRKPARPEISGPMQTYLDLHRHAAVRAALVAHPRVALRLMVAHAIAGSPLWSVRSEPRTARNEQTAESVETAPSETVFDERRRAVLGLLGFDPDAPNVIGGRLPADPSEGGPADPLAAIFERLLELPDPALGEIVTVVIGETLASGSPVVEAVGLRIGVDMASAWQADDAFFALVRDREVLGRIVAEVAGEAVAAANAGEKTRVLKQIVRDTLAGENGRARCARWVPRWMAFPPAAYTTRGGVATVAAHARAFGSSPDATPEAQPAAPPEAQPEVQAGPQAETRRDPGPAASNGADAEAGDLPRDDRTALAA